MNKIFNTTLALSLVCSGLVFGSAKTPKNILEQAAAEGCIKELEKAVEEFGKAAGSFSGKGSDITRWLHDLTKPNTGLHILARFDRHAHEDIAELSDNVREINKHLDLLGQQLEADIHGPAGAGLYLQAPSTPKQAAPQERTGIIQDTYNNAVALRNRYEAWEKTTNALVEETAKMAERNLEMLALVSAVYELEKGKDATSKEPCEGKGS